MLSKKKYLNIFSDGSLYFYSKKVLKNFKSFEFLEKDLKLALNYKKLKINNNNLKLNFINKVLKIEPTICCRKSKTSFKNFSC